MNMIEKQVEVGKSLFEINKNTMSEMAELSRKNIETYFEVNRSFGEKLPEIREISAFLEMQREYGETLWNNAREAMESQTAILKGAFEETRDVLATAYSMEDAAPAKKSAKKKAAAES